MSTKETRTTTMTRTTTDDKAVRREKFEKVYLGIREELLEHFKAQGMPDEAVEWYRRNLDHNVPGGKLNRGMSVVDSVEILKGRELGEEEYVKAGILGWCVELLQAFFLVADDIMDQSFTRRGQPCWFRREGVGHIAINDAFMLEAAIYHLLKKHFRGERYYVDLVDLFHETTYQTEMGQLIDLITAPEDRVDLGKFSAERHRLIVIYKTAFYSFYLPVAVGMYMCGIPASYAGMSPLAGVRPYDVARSILIPVGEYFQIQDDFLDFAADPEVLGKVGTDIIDNKCSWCINRALSVASEEQRRVLHENYGRKESERERKVKEVYEEVGLRSLYGKYEEETYTRLLGLIENVPETASGEPSLRREVFKRFVDKIYKRNK